jgi:membrane carboxypeptidase/penicillin-binding protein
LRRSIVAIAVTIAVLISLSKISYAFLNLPSTSSLDNLNFKTATQVLDSNEQLISKLFEENRRKK